MLQLFLGVEKTEDSVTDAQLVMICWNAWSPYQKGSFTLADTINGTLKCKCFLKYLILVPLVGGPRPNPDDVLCFKNLLAIDRMDSPALNQTEPKIHLRFNFAIVEAMVCF